MINYSFRSQTYMILKIISYNDHKLTLKLLIDYFPVFRVKRLVKN